MTDETPTNLEMQQNKPEKNDEIVYNSEPEKKEKEEVAEKRRATLDALEELEEKDGPIFSDSTHRYLIYYDQIKSKSGFCLALLVLITQISLYAILEGEPREIAESGVVPVEIDYYECSEYLGRHNFATLYNNRSNFWGEGYNVTADTIKVKGAQWIDEEWHPWVNLQCEINEWQIWTKENAGVFILSLVLIWCFTANDFLSSVAVIARIPSYWSKFVGIIILFEIFFAIHICNLNLYAASFSGNKFDAILNTVGVLFIHDMDEAMFSALKVIDKKYVVFCKTTNNKFYKFLRDHVQVVVLLAYAGLICASYGISRSTIDPARQ